MKRLASYFRDPENRADMFDVCFPIGLALLAGGCIGFVLGATP